MDPEELLDDPFRPKPQYRRPPTRYSDGSWPVFYSALERETAEKEVACYYVSGAIGDPSKGRIAYLSVFRCRFSGEARDLRPKREEWGELISPHTDNPFCQSLGREAIEAAIDGFLAPSARRSDGTTVPVFSRDSLSHAHIDGDASFRFDTTTNKYIVAYN